MGALAEYLKAEAERLRSEGQMRNEAIREWQESVRRLFATLTEWLEKADGGLGLIGWREDEHRVKEPRLGEYSCPKLSIHVGVREQDEFFVKVAEVVPKARFVLADLRPAGREPRAADGVVEIREWGSASHYLFRWKNPGGDEWFIRNDAVWNNRSYEDVKPLTAEAFELAVLSAVK
jgi:hypothetical protein